MPKDRMSAVTHTGSIRIERMAAAKKIASSLIPTETAIDSAILQTLGLSAAILEGRSMANVAAEIGHEALEDVAEAMRAMVAARGSVIAAHRHLAETKDRVGLPELGMGDLGCQPKGLIRPKLSSVTEAAVSPPSA